MSDVGYELFALLFLVLSLILSFWQIKLCLKRRDWQIFFWAGAIYFAIYPMLTDVTLMLGGGLEKFHDTLAQDNPNYWGGVYAAIAFKAAVFIFLYCIVFYYSDAFLRSKIPEKTRAKYFRFNSMSLVLLLVLSVLPCVLLYFEGADYIYNQKNEVTLSKSAAYLGVLIPLGPVVAYGLLQRKRYFLSFIFFLPISIVAFLGQSRSLFFLVPGAIIFYVLGNSRQVLGVGRLFISLVLLLVLSQAVKLIGNENYGYWTTDNKFAFIIANTFRDGSVGDLYYSFHVRETEEKLTTEGRSSLALAMTGIIPPFLGRNMFDAQNTVTYRIYQLRFGEYDFGSMHPTVFGYFYFDLGFLGILSAFFLAFILRFYVFIMSRYEFSSSIPPVMIAGFYFVAMRGSLNVAYFRFIYGGVAIFLVLLFVCHIQKMLSSSASISKQL